MHRLRAKDRCWLELSIKILSAKALFVFLFLFNKRRMESEINGATDSSMQPKITVISSSHSLDISNQTATINTP
jgi:hypothetical protein